MADRLPVDTSISAERLKCVVDTLAIPQGEAEGANGVGSGEKFDFDCVVVAVEGCLEGEFGLPEFDSGFEGVAEGDDGLGCFGEGSEGDEVGGGPGAGGGVLQGVFGAVPEVLGKGDCRVFREAAGSSAFAAEAGAVSEVF
ncbi:hypothetical protein [Kitasatospora herbaricolor]|uniref:Uncharacterized protein n=1 Tax=Kitasatospora herbaricolor TaxID=68217 RepID=A0ABZ1WJB7_9ACTN|nr:hypothetical protein [Kitasatospora herbaricolor]